MSVSRRLGAVLRLSSGLLVILTLAWIASAVATGSANRHLLNARAAHTATAQMDGSLVIAGGTGNRGVLKSLEFFDPVSGKSTPGPRLIEARSGHSAIALADGRVLLTGGRNGDNALLASSEIYDAAGGGLNPGASLGHARANHTSTLLADGRVLIAGGDAEGIAELYDPATDRFADAGKLAVARSGHSAVRLGDGRVLLVGGYDAAGATAEIFDPRTNTFSTVRGGLKTARLQPTLKLISDGKVQVYGGDAEITMEVYNPTGYFSSRGHLLRDSSAFRSIMYSPGQAALIAIPSAKSKHYAEDALGPAAGEFERTGHTATEVAARSTMVVVGGIGATGAVLDTVTELGSCSGTVTTDLTDYFPGQTVVMSGSGWTPGEQITLNLHRDTNDPPDTVLYATADENGDWINAEYVVQQYDLNVTFVLTATGDSGCTAQTTFTDSSTPPGVNFFTAGLPAGTVISVSFFRDSNGGGTDPLVNGCPATAGTVSVTAPGPGSRNGNEPLSTFCYTFPSSVVAGAVTYSLVSASPASPLTLADAGGGDTNVTGTYAPAVSSTSTLLVSSSNPSAFGSSVTFTATVTSGVNPVTTGSVTIVEGSCAAPTASLLTSVTPNSSGQVTVSTSALTAGSHPIAACYTPSASFTASNGSLSQVVNATSTTTVSCPTSVVYTGSAQTPCTASYSTTDGLSGSLTVTYSSNVDVGTAHASATYAGDTYHASSSDAKTFAITQATSTTTVTCPASVAYTGSAQTPCSASYSTSDGLSGSLSVSYSNNTNVGTASASANYTGDSNHAGSNDTKTFAITQATSTTTVTCPASVVYNGSPQTPCSASYSTSDGQSGTLTVNYTNNTDAGTATASASYAGDANHAPSSDSKNFTIEQAPSVTTVTCPANVTYSGSALTPCSALVTGANLSQSLTVTYSNNTDAGTATASASFAGDANHTGSSDSKTFTIDKAPSVTTVTCPANVTYTGSALTPCSALVTGANLSQSLTVTYTNNINVGTATASAAFAGDANHTGSSDSKTFTIDKAPSVTTVTCPANVTYTGSALTPCSALVTGANLSQSLSVTYSNNINVGTATASAAFAGDANHTGSNDSKTFTIDKAPSVTTVTCPASVTFTGSALTPCSASVTGANLSQTLTVTYSNNINAGTATASASYSGDSNHTGSSDSKTFTILQAPSVTIISCPAHVTYTGLAQTPCTATVTGAGGLSMSLTAAISYSNNVNAGTASASVSYAGDANHLPSSDSKTFVIDKVVLTVTADNQSKIFGDPNPTLTYQITGFVNGETVVTAPVLGAPNCTTTAGQFSPVGTYPITCTIGTLTAANYSFTFVGATLTIGARSALVNYIGQQVFVTSGSSSTTAQVTLSASVQDPTGLGLSGAKVDFIDCSTIPCGKTLASGVPVSPVQNEPNFTGTANTIVTLSTGQYGAQSYQILVRLTGNYDNSKQPVPDKTASVVVMQPAANLQTTGGGLFAAQGTRAGTYAGTAGPEEPSFSVGLTYTNKLTNLKGQITLNIPQADGIVYVKSNSISSMAITGSGASQSATIYTKSSMYEVFSNGTSVAIDGNVTLRMDIVEGSPAAQVGFTVLSSKDSSLYYSNNWQLVPTSGQSVWKTVVQGTDNAPVTID
ncbi:MAG TPA: kelch repeat-containing protein [Rhodanobacteraceae bacterium]|nr:kelch repeat-containing protein [Rhodanobacteraceae bacterium]